eukprot:249298-Chlamydomonas_euryale.AAC.5
MTCGCPTRAATCTGVRGGAWKCGSVEVQHAWQRAQVCEAGWEVWECGSATRPAMCTGVRSVVWMCGSEDAQHARQRATSVWRCVEVWK